jgi:alpha-1,3-rhamnosyltransferase
MDTPLVSIVIPCYNHEKFVQDCIQSVIDQTYENIELIIIDDGSKDDSVSKIREMIPKCEKRFVRFEFRNRPNKGLSATLNEAIDWCRGDYFSAIASDDQLLSDKIKNQIRVFSYESKEHTVAIFGGVILIDDNGNQIDIKRLPASYYDFENILLHNCAFYAATQLIKTNAIRKVGKYRTDILVEDWYMWLKLAEIGNIYCTDEVYAKYRWHANNTTKNYELIFRENLKTISQYKDNLHYVEAYNKLYWVYINSMAIKHKKHAIIEFSKEIARNPKRVIGFNTLRFFRNLFLRKEL